MMSGRFMQNPVPDTRGQRVRIIQHGRKVDFGIGVQAGLQFAVAGDADAVARRAKIAAHGRN